VAETTGVNVIDKAAELSRAVGVAQSMLAGACTRPLLTST